MDEKPNPFRSPDQHVGSPYHQQMEPVQSPPLREPPSPDTAYGFAVAGMCFGILSIVTVCVCWPVSFVLAVPGVILSMIGRKSRGGKGMALAGLICSIISLVLGVMFLALVIVSAIVSPQQSPSQWP